MTTDRPVLLDPDQKYALERIMSGKNIAIMGKAGSGKSTILRVLETLRPKDTAFLGPTGLAALNIGGSTIHSFFHLPVTTLLPDIAASIEPTNRACLDLVKTIVLDEFSMIRSDVFQAIDTILRSIAPPGRRALPFGGKQIVAVGDPFQLGPVVRRADREELEEHFPSKWAFATSAWERAEFECVWLTESHRHGLDRDFLEALDCLRCGGFGADSGALEASIDWLNRHVRMCPPPDDAVVLCARRKEAERINAERAGSVAGLLFTYTARITGVFGRDLYPTDTKIPVGVGSRVTIRRNRTCGGGFEYANGQMGLVVGLPISGQGLPVQLDDGRTVYVKPEVWENRVYSVREDSHTGRLGLVHRAIGRFTQIAVRPAYALTVHGAQGATLSRAHVQMGDGMFAAGQLYTAASRAKSAAGLSLDRELRREDVIVDRAVIDFYAKMLDGREG